MSRGNKLERFAQMKTFTNVLEPDGKMILMEDFDLKGKWSRQYFKNDKPITLELGCGKGEYTVGLADRYPERNFIGIDIKGARMWKGAKFALENKIPNAAFIRTRIEFIEKIFGPGEVDEIWITFPDPFPKKPGNRLSGSVFFNRYRKIMKEGGIVHLKTDSRQLHDYTLDVLEASGINPEVATNDLYAPGQELDEILALKTYYEKIFLAENKAITYLRFRMTGVDKFEETDKAWK